MSAGRKQILSPFIGHKKRKAWNNTKQNICLKKENKIYLKQAGDHITIKEWVEEFIDDKGTFYNGSESDDGDNDYVNYNENMEAVVRRCSSK